MSKAVAAGDMATVGRWVLEAGSTRIRQTAAQAITDPDQLRELIRLTRGKDKNVHRILTAKRDALLAEQRHAQQREAEISAAAAAIARHSERACDAAYARTLERLEARWQAVASQADAELQREVSRRLSRAREAIEQHAAACAAEAERARAAELAATEARRQHDLDEQAAAQAAAEHARLAAAEREAELSRHRADETEVRRILGLLRQAQAALDRGATARASRLRDEIKEQLPHAPSLPAWFDRKLQEVDARIEELKDWKTFTVVPKRAELVQRMQALVGAEMSPEELARQVRRLRDEWRTLHRGAADEPAPEREQFEAAAERAYEPCRMHFAQQAEQRKENQARREALLEQLAGFVAGQTGDDVNWRLVQQTLSEARREWRQYAPVDQSVVKDLQERFHALTNDLHGRLEAEYKRNVAARQALVARAAELAGAEDVRQAIEEAKHLQRAWRTVGLVPRHQDNALWEEFRKHCDAVFQRSSEESAALAAALEGNQARAVALCDELERIAGLAGEDLLTGAKRLGDLRSEFESLELPRATARDLRQRYGRAIDRCDEALRRHRAAAERQGWRDLFGVGAKVCAYALAVARHASAEECDALQASAAGALDQLPSAPRDARAMLEKQMHAIAGGTVSGDLAANEAALRLLCVRAELLAGVPTPQEDLELRREYQMQRLVESMGRGERATPTDLDDLALEWLAVGPVETAVHEALLTRFERCREAGTG